MRGIFLASAVAVTTNSALKSAPLCSTDSSTSKEKGRNKPTSNRQPVGLGWVSHPHLKQTQNGATSFPKTQETGKEGKHVACRSPASTARAPPQPGGDLPAAARGWARTDSGMGSWGDVYPHTDAPTKGYPIQTSLLPPASFPVLTRAERRCSATPPEASEDFFFPSCHATHVFCYCLISFFFPTHGKIPQKRGAYFLPNSSRLLDLENTPFLRRAPRARPAGAGTELTQLPARASAPNEPAQPR